MRPLLLTLALISFFSITKTYAVHTTTAPVNSGTTFLPSLTVSDFLSVDLKQYRTTDGKKLKFTQRISLGLLQKNLAKKVRNGKIDASTPLLSDEGRSLEQKFGLLSVIFSVLGIAFLFIPNALVLLGLGCAIAGLVLGILGLKKDEDPLLAVIGVVLSGLVVLIYVIAVLAIGSVF